MKKQAKYLIGGLVVLGGLVAGIVAGMRKNAEESAPTPAPAPKPAPAAPPPKPPSFYPSEAERQKRLDTATAAVQSGDQAAIQAAMGRLSPEDRAKLQAMLPKI